MPIFSYNKGKGTFKDSAKNNAEVEVRHVRMVRDLYIRAGANAEVNEKNEDAKYSAQVVKEIDKVLGEYETDPAFERAQGLN